MNKARKGKRKKREEEERKQGKYKVEKKKQ